MYIYMYVFQIIVQYLKSMNEFRYKQLVEEGEEDEADLVDQVRSPELLSPIRLIS